MCDALQLDEESRQRSEIERLQREFEETRKHLEFARKRTAVLRAAQQVKFDFLAQENANHQFEVGFICRTLGLSRSRYYTLRKRGICGPRRPRRYQPSTASSRSNRVDAAAA